MTRMRAIVAAFLFLVPGSLAGQDWGVSWLPTLRPAANEFPFISLFVDYSVPADYYAPFINNGALTGSAGVSFKGSWFATARFRAPGLAAKWRFDVFAVAIQEKRFGYYGVGNETTYDRALGNRERNFYRVRRSRYAGQAEVTRALMGPLRISLALRAQQTEFEPLDGVSLFTADFAGRTISESDASARVSLAIDTRDTEYNTKKGVFFEAGGKAATGGDGYTWLYSILKGFVSPVEGTVIGARVAGGTTGGTPPLSQRYEFNTWEQDRDSYGGRFTNRGFTEGRFAGESVIMGNLEIRHDLLSLGDLGGITLLAFGDAGRVFEMEAFSLDDLKWGAGGGFDLRVLRSNIWTFNFSGGSEGFRFLFGWGWVF